MRKLMDESELEVGSATDDPEEESSESEYSSLQESSVDDRLSGHAKCTLAMIGCSGSVLR